MQKFHIAVITPAPSMQVGAALTGLTAIYDHHKKWQHWKS
jgi:hypothetical protein